MVSSGQWWSVMIICGKWGSRVVSMGHIGVLSGQLGRGAYPVS